MSIPAGESYSRNVMHTKLYIYLFIQIFTKNKDIQHQTIIKFPHLNSPFGHSVGIALPVGQ
jgi:hypothetical protein